MAEPLAASRLVTNPNAAAGASHVPQVSDHAGIGPRIIAYLIDSVVLSAFFLVFIAISAVNIYVSSDSGNSDPSDGETWNSVLIALLAVPAWFVVGVLFDLKRGQSLGKYMVGLRVVRSDGRPAGFSRHLTHWLALHPLLFHPVIAGFWALFTWASISFTESTAIYLAGLAATLLCFLAPIVNFVFALGDPLRRGVHDLIAGTKVVRIE